MGDDSGQEKKREFFPEESVYELEPFVLPAGRLSGSSETDTVPGMIESQISEHQSSDHPDHLGSDQLVSGFLSEDIEASRGLELQEEFSSTSSLYEMQPFVLPGDPRDHLTKQAPDAPPEEPLPEAGEEAAVVSLYRKMTSELAQQAKSDPLIGQVLAKKYKIIGLVGEGNMAIVYKAVDIKTAELVAVKSHLPDASDDSKKRFLQEIRTHSKLTHRNIVRYIDFFVDQSSASGGLPRNAQESPHPGRAFLVMENVRGISLADVLRIHGPIRHEETIWLVLSQICAALTYAHEEGTIHRDLKTGNVVLSKGNDDDTIEVKLLDFGIARTEDAKKAGLTQEGKTVGSPYYMSPEQCYGLELSPVSDVYSLGLLAYEIVSGKRAYSFTKLMDVIKAHCDPRIKPAPMIDSAPDFAHANKFDRIIRRALSTDPSERQQSAAHFQNELDAWIAKVRSGEVASVEHMILSSPETTENDLSFSSEAQSPRAIVIATAISVVFVMLITTIYWLFNIDQLIAFRDLLF